MLYEVITLYSDDRTDPVRAAYLNGVIAGSLDWDDRNNFV